MGIGSTSSKNLEEQARLYRVVTDIVLNNENCPHFVIWGLKDNDSWRNASNPLLYDAGLGKKAAWYAVRSALRHRTLINTSVHAVTQATPSDEACYDLQGRRMLSDQLRPGLYIKKGEKRIVR